MSMSDTDNTCVLTLCVVTNSQSELICGTGRANAYRAVINPRTTSRDRMVTRRSLLVDGSGVTAMGELGL